MALRARNCVALTTRWYRTVAAELGVPSRRTGIVTNFDDPGGSRLQGPAAVEALKIQPGQPRIE
jgi:hypothetical protein